jgi:hypothetical protein
VLLLEGAHFMVFHRIGRHFFLLQLLSQFVVHLSLFVVEFVELDLG